MARDEPSRSAVPVALSRPAISLVGRIEAAMVDKLHDALAQADDGADIAIELTTAGGDVSLDEVCDKALRDWYLTADEAERRGLLSGIV